MGARWFHLAGGEQRGPFDLRAMRDLVLGGTVRPDTYVWCDGMSDWMRAREVPSLVPPPETRAEVPAWIGVEDQRDGPFPD